MTFVMDMGSTITAMCARCSAAGACETGAPLHLVAGREKLSADQLEREPIEAVESRRQGYCCLRSIWMAESQKKDREHAG